MRIKIADYMTKRTLGKIIEGEVFGWNGAYYMKMAGVTGEGYNCIDLKTGDLVSIGWATDVCPVEAELIIFGNRREQ